MKSFFSEDPLHKLLMRAALDEGLRGRKSFQIWQARVSLTDVDYPSQKILSAVGHHLIEDDASREVIKIAKFTWLKSQMLLNAGFRAHEVLQKSGIPVAWIKGTAVLFRTATQIATRPMEDIDLLIPLNRVSEATELLNTAGFYSLADKELIQCPDLITRNQHGIAFKDSSGAEVDLHWQAFKGIFCTPCEDALWQRTSIANRFGQKHYVISAEDLLLHVIASNKEGNDVYWVLDAVRIIDNNVIDFSLLFSIARARNLRKLCLVALAIISTFKPKAIPLKYRIRASIVQKIYSVSRSVVSKSLIQNLFELPKLRIPKYINLSSTIKIASTSEWVTKQQNIELQKEQFTIFFGTEAQPWFRNSVAATNWHQAEKSGNWSSARIAHLDFSIHDQFFVFKVKVVYWVISSKYVKLRRIGIFLNGRLIHRKLLYSPHGHLQESEFVISRPNLIDPIKLSFFVSSTIIPRDHLLNPDQRNLGVFLQKIVISRHLS